MLCLVLLSSSAVLGCSKATPDKNTGLPRKIAIPTKEEKKTLLQTTGLDGVVKGRVAFEGGLPEIKSFISKMNYHGDKEGCLKGAAAEKMAQTWFINKENQGVQNIVVWLEAPPGTFFPVAEPDKKRDGERVVIDQPHCAFVPHVASLFPSYFDGTQQVQTGQKLEVRNSAPFMHSLSWNPSRQNDAYNKDMPPNGGKREFVLNPQKGCLALGCGIHNWMTAFLWIFDHPYHAVTKEDGSFEIKNVPTGTEVTLNAWHESHINPFEQRKVTFQKGENPALELRISQPEYKTKK